MSKILITGASKGIGLETALVLAKAGHAVVATMRRPGESDLADIAKRDGLAITVAELDVDSDASVAKVFGPGGDGAAETLDALVNNAGVYSINAVEDESLGQFQAVMNTNFFGTLRCCKAVAGAMRRRGAGVIVNVTSVAGRIVGPASAAYASSKFATEAMTEALAAELGGYGVRVALVEPGIIATPMTVENLPKPKSGTGYLQGGRMRAFYAPTAAGGPAPTVVAETIRDVIEGRSSQFRNPSGPDATPFLQLRASQSDEDWIGMVAARDDESFFARFQAISGMDMRPPKGW